MKRQYKFFPKIFQLKGDGGFVLSLRKDGIEGKQYFSESFSSLSDAITALDFCRLACFECCREDCIAPLPD